MLLASVAEMVVPVDDPECTIVSFGTDWVVPAVEPEVTVLLEVETTGSAAPADPEVMAAPVLEEEVTVESTLVVEPVAEPAPTPEPGILGMAAEPEPVPELVPGSDCAFASMRLRATNKMHRLAFRVTEAEK
jgi:hypothetical protein